MSRVPRKKEEHEWCSRLLNRALLASELPSSRLAKPCEVVPRTVARWLAGETLPNPFQQRNIVHVLHATGRVPRDLLEELASASADTLESLDIVRRAPPPPAPPPVPADAQRIVDDAIREAAEALDVTPRTLRPIVSQLLDALARGAVPVDAGARLAVAGGPKKG